MGTLTVRRLEKGGRDRLRAYKVLIDGQDVGKLKPGQSLQLEVSPGPHSVQVAVDWKRSARFDVSGDREEVLTFRCGPRGGALKAWSDMLKHEDDTWLFLEPDGPPSS